MLTPFIVWLPGPFLYHKIVILATVLFSSASRRAITLIVYLEFPVRLLGRPLGPRDTPPSFSKKQEYL